VGTTVATSLTQPVRDMFDELIERYGKQRNVIEAAIWLMYHMGPRYQEMAVTAVVRIRRGKPAELPEERMRRLAREFSIAYEMAKATHGRRDDDVLAEIKEAATIIAEQSRASSPDTPEPQ